MGLVGQRRHGTGEEGQILPVVLTAIIAIIAITMMLLQVGKAGLLRTRDQTAADAAALAAVEEIRDTIYGFLDNGIIPSSSLGLTEDELRAVAAEYAERNGSELTDFEFQSGFGQWAVSVETRSAEEVRIQSSRAGAGDMRLVASHEATRPVAADTNQDTSQEKRSTAESVASLTFPCDQTPGGTTRDEDGDPVHWTVVVCGSDVVARWVAGTSPPGLTEAVGAHIEPSLEEELPALPGGVTFNGNLAHAKGEQISREKIAARAAWWEDQGIPYSMSAYHLGPDGEKQYRTDCSGFVSMAWGLKTSLTTTTLQGVARRLGSKDELKRGDILLNSEGAGAGSHVVLFLGWVPGTNKTEYIGIEQRGGDGTVRTRGIPYGYFSESSEYHPWRYTNLDEG